MLTPILTMNNTFRGICGRCWSLGALIPPIVNDSGINSHCNVISDEFLRLHVRKLCGTENLPGSRNPPGLMNSRPLNPALPAHVGDAQGARRALALFGRAGGDEDQHHDGEQVGQHVQPDAQYRLLTPAASSRGSLFCSHALPAEPTAATSILRTCRLLKPAHRVNYVR